MHRRSSHRVLVLLIATCALLLPGVLAAGQVQAQALPPTRFFGTVFISGLPAAPGSAVAAYANGVLCGSTNVGANSGYRLDVAAAATQPGCGFEGALVTFTVNSLPARESSVFQPGAFVELNLNAGVPIGRSAQVNVERWVRYSDEPCALPSDGWCISSYRLPEAREPFARYRMLTVDRFGVTRPASEWVYVTPNTPTSPVSGFDARGVVRVLWERARPLSFEPCRALVDDGWCVEATEVRPPLTGVAWYRLLVTQPNGTVEQPTSFIAAFP